MTETKTPSPTPGVANQNVAMPDAKSSGGVFAVAVLGMSWQLAIVVLVPIVGGFELDNLFATSPLLIIIGFLVAIVGFALVVRRQLQIFSPPAPNTSTIKPKAKGPAA